MTHLFISDEDFSQCSHDAVLVAEKADAFIRGLYNELETVKAQTDATSITAEQTCSLLEQKYVSLSDEFSKLEAHNTHLQSSLDQRLSELAEVQSRKHQLTLLSIGKDGEIERLKTELSELQSSKRQLMELAEHKDLEISDKNATIKSYLDRFVSLSNTGAQREVRLSEIEAELVRSQSVCTRLSQEKELIERHNTWLNDELSAKVDSLIDLRKTHSNFEAELSSKLANVQRQFDDCSKSLNWNKERVRELEMKLASLQEELCSSKEAAATNEEQLSAELSTVNKLVELYKASSDEWSQKAGELEGVIKALETHLSQVESDYKERLEKEESTRKQFEKEATELKAKLEKCEVEIETTRKANELNLLPLGSFTTDKWMDSFAVNNILDDNRSLVPTIPLGISGTALAASLLRDGWSLGKMYAKYQETVDALRHEQLGRKEAEAVLQRVLYELEEKAEVILEERAEHERMTEAYSILNQKLQYSISEQNNLEKHIQELKADLRRCERDHTLAHKENIDLQRQVTVLLKECRDIQIRCGSVGHESSDNGSESCSLDMNAESATENVISEHLLTFKDINGLVEQNVQLRGLVRSLSDQLENRERESKEKFEMELKKHADEAASKVAVVLQRAKEQGHMIDSLHTSVAMYKRLYEQEHTLNSSHPFSVEASPDAGRTDLKLLLLQSSQEATKNAQEQAAERVRVLEEDLARSRSEMISLRSQRDKLELEANFAKERLDSFMKEYEHQRVEMNGVLARNVEFSHLIVDYQRKLRENSESLNDSEECSRKLTMEVSVLKNEKEILLNAEKRACDEVRNLTERVHRLRASLDTIQSAEEVREEARVSERKRQEVYTKQIEKDWAEAKKELQEERDSNRTLTFDREQTIKNAMRQVEEMGKELANALHALAAAETRAAVTEAKLSDLEKQMKISDNQVVEVDGQIEPSSLLSNEVVAELNVAKLQIAKFKAEAQASKDHMLQYKNIAQVNEDALKQMECAHENFKIEANRLKKSLEGELLSLRRRVSELEDESIMKLNEVTSAAAGKEEILASYLAEITSLKEESAAKTSRVEAMEIQIYILKENLERENQRWRAAQDNFERQVSLQSDTLLELKQTSLALASLQGEAAELHKSEDTLKRENNELKTKWEHEKALLEELKKEADKKYSELNEQNKILHSQLEALHIQLAEKDRNSAGISTASNAPDTLGDAGLQNVMSYLRRTKEIAETEISLLKQEKLRMQSQLESALKAAETAQASLKAEHQNSRALLLTEEEIKSLQLQVREMNLLRESNMQLREENKHNFEECQKLREMTQKLRADSVNLESLLKERQVEVESCKMEIEILKMEKNQLQNKISELLEKSKHIDVEDYNRMIIDVQQMKDELRDKDEQIEQINGLLSEKQDTVSRLEQDLSSHSVELNEKEKKLNEVFQAEANLKSEVEKQKKILSQLKRKFDIVFKEKEEVNKENQALSKQLEDLKQGKRSSADTTGEQAMREERDTKIQILEKHLERQRDELKKEKEDHRTEKTRRLKIEKAIKDTSDKVEQEKLKFVNELEKHRQATNQLSDEVEKLKQAKGNLPEGTSMIQPLTGNTFDDLAAAYFLAVENFEKSAQSIFIELGGNGASSNTSPAPDSSLPSSSSPAPGVASSITPATSHFPAKVTEESEKKSNFTKTIAETRKGGRKLVRPRLVKPEEPPGDVEMSEIEATNNDGKPPSSNDVETRSNLSSLRKRLASSSLEFHEHLAAIHGVPGIEVGVPVLKKSKGSDSSSDVAEGQFGIPLDTLGTQLANEEASEVNELPLASGEEAFDPEKEEIEIPGEKVEEPKDHPFDGVASQADLQSDKNDVLEENLDGRGGAELVSDDGLKDQVEPEHLRLATDVGNEREEGELVPDVPEIDGGGNEMERSELGDGQSEPVVTPDASPARHDDESLAVTAMDAGEINSSEVPYEEKNDERDAMGENAEVLDKSNDGNDKVTGETDHTGEATSVAEENVSTSTTTAPEVSVSKQGSPNASSDVEDVKRASPVTSSNASTTINLQERAKERAMLRQAGVVSSSVRGRGRVVRGRGVRGGRSSRGGRIQPGEHN